jgi:hypothetical protein
MLTNLDNTIIATAIPKITSVFDSLEDVGWYGKNIRFLCRRISDHARNSLVIYQYYY